jgi:pseudaminic acid biosynthesis-associated methylase
LAGLSAIEINQKAVAELEKLGYLEKIYHTSILDFTPDYQRDLVFIKGVMIHLNPEVLPQVYDLLYQSSKRYILVMEYFNPTPVELTYRGHSGKLFKRDFAGEILDRFPDLQLLDYGFCYERDYMFPNGDGTWFLMEKR